MTHINDPDQWPRSMSYKKAMWILYWGNGGKINIYWEIVINLNYKLHLGQLDNLVLPLDSTVTWKSKTSFIFIAMEFDFVLGFYECLESHEGKIDKGVIGPFI